MFFSLIVLALSSRYDKYNALLGYGVIGNTPVFGTGILGSSPSSPTLLKAANAAFFIFLASYPTPLSFLCLSSSLIQKKWRRKFMRLGLFAEFGHLYYLHSAVATCEMWSFRLLIENRYVLF